MRARFLARWLPEEASLCFDRDPYVMDYYSPSMVEIRAFSVLNYESGGVLVTPCHTILYYVAQIDTISRFHTSSLVLRIGFVATTNSCVRFETKKKFQSVESFIAIPNT